MSADVGLQSEPTTTQSDVCILYECCSQLRKIACINTYERERCAAELLNRRAAVYTTVLLLRRTDWRKRNRCVSPRTSEANQSAIGSMYSASVSKRRIVENVPIYVHIRRTVTHVCKKISKLFTALIRLNVATHHSTIVSSANHAHVRI